MARDAWTKSTFRDIRESVHVHLALSEVVQRGFSGQFTRGGEHSH
jgi:dihydrolipoamide dehydrogenase